MPEYYVNSRLHSTLIPLLGSPPSISTGLTTVVLFRRHEGPMNSSLSLSVSTSFLPPIVQEQQTGEPGDVEAERQEGLRLSDPASPALCDQQKKLDDNRSLLEEVR